MQRSGYEIVSVGCLGFSVFTSTPCHVQFQHQLNVIRDLRFSLSYGHDPIDICHIQAALMLTLTHIAVSKLETAWLLSAQASNMMMAYSSNTLINGDDCITRTTRGCLYLDALLSAFLHRSSCWRHDDLDVLKHKLDLDSSDEWQPWKNGTENVTAEKPQSLQALSQLESTMDIIKLAIDYADRAQVIQNLLNWRLMPQNSTIMSATIVSPALLNLQSIWFLLVRWHANPDQAQLETIQRMETATAATVGCYIEKAGSSMAMPLISMFLMQVGKSKHQSSAIDLLSTEGQQSTLCGNLYTKPKNLWVDWSVEPSNHKGNSFPHNAQAGETRENAHDRNARTSDENGLSMDRRVVQSSLNPDYSSASQNMLLNMFDENIPADSLDELSPLVPVHRYVV